MVSLLSSRSWLLISSSSASHRFAIARMACFVAAVTFSIGPGRRATARRMRVILGRPLNDWRSSPGRNGTSWLGPSETAAGERQGCV